MWLSLEPKYTIPSTIVGVERITPPVAKLPSSSPESAVSAYRLWSSEPAYTTPSATAGAMSTRPRVVKDQIWDGLGANCPGPSTPVSPGGPPGGWAANSGTHPTRPRPKDSRSMASSGVGSPVEAAASCDGLKLVNRVRTQLSCSSVRPPDWAAMSAMNNSRAVSSEMQSIRATDSWSAPCSEKGRSRIRSRRSSPVSPRMQDCSASDNES